VRLWLRSTILGVALGLATVTLFPRLIGMGQPRPAEGMIPLALARSGPMPASFAPAVAQAAPAVVNIYTSKVVTRAYHPLLDDPVFGRFFGHTPIPRQRLQSALGSGVLVGGGRVLTNNHVIEDADEIKVALNDGRTTTARLIGSDPDTDLALLHTELADAPSMRAAAQRPVLVGDVVLAIGNPFGVGQTVTLGIVSATGRQHLGLTTVEEFIQTDAAINPGNSGGALVNAAGELIGINTAIYSRTGGYQGIGFAVPGPLALQVADELAREGRVRRGWFGWELQDLTPQLAASLGVASRPGAVVAGVYRDSPAHRAGVQPGDVVRAINGAQVLSAGEAQGAERRLRPGARAQVEIERAGDTVTRDLTAADPPR
jgi:Do/DeqQ family serine protease